MKIDNLICKSMKKCFYYLCVVLVGVVCLNSCDDDDDNIRLANVPEKVLVTMEEMYPNVTIVEWEKYREYYVAEFWYQGVERHVWFSGDGTWRMTKTDMGHSLEGLPEIVRNAFLGTQYATWEVDDVAMFERPDFTFYLVEVEANGQRDRDLFFATDGTSLKNEVDNYDREVTPDTELH